MTPSERKQKIAALKNEAKVTLRKAYDLVQLCPHKILIQEKPDGKLGYDFAECEGCDKSFGWYCPDSPDHVCHYFSETGKIELIAGEWVEVPDCDEKRQSSDCCMFCGWPDERK